MPLMNKLRKRLSKTPFRKRMKQLMIISHAPFKKRLTLKGMMRTIQQLRLRMPKVMFTKRITIRLKLISRLTLSSTKLSAKFVHLYRVQKRRCS